MPRTPARSSTPASAATASTNKAPTQTPTQTPAQKSGKTPATAAATDAAPTPPRRKRSAKGEGSTPTAKVPGTYKAFIAKFPDLGAAHEKVAKAAERAGPLDAKTLALIKVGICIGAGLESALRSHVRRAMHHGATEQEIEQAILLGMNTVGFPRTVAAWAWAQEQFSRGA